MKYFPAYLRIDDKRVLLIGGGSIAYDKFCKLLDFTDDITIIAKNIKKELNDKAKKNGIKIEKKEYKDGDMDGYDIVIVAINDIDRQKEIYLEAKKKNILCNVVDVIECCDFIFPSYIKEGDLNISISTSGSSPAVAKHLKRYIKDILPKDLSSFIKEMKHLRDTLPKGKERMKFLDSKAEKFFKKVE